ncbi:G-protein coupled receptor Mth-like isoform X2 [Diabrotica virgifera virgifera]|uniref:G-protein coupled receptor Mth-like isoform X2 n=1 Tax=Diabrotica virgifera virgifera TaxID=50390 RepID=A0A6P7GRH0_DIAVI|nr:G-protein coupled receptor Mth-like isoform X2 [Diabrotica virgifera virgifera]
MDIMNLCTHCIIVYFFGVACIEGQQVDSTDTTPYIVSKENIIFPKIPKCCISKTQVWINNTCEETSHIIEYKNYYYESNETHIYDKQFEFEPIFYEHQLDCDGKYYLTNDEVLGFIYNSSFITEYEFDIIGPEDYCINSKDDKQVFLMCADKVPSQISKGQVYFPCLIISTACYFFSAGIYIFLLKVKDVHKKCFVGYSISMCVTFFCLILLQKVHTGCNIIGSIFYVFILASFVWLCCLCLDIVHVVRNFAEDKDPERIYLYIAGSILFPCVVLVISIIPTGIPDVPISFMKGRGMCMFKDTATRIAILFIPMVLLLLAAVASLVYSFYLIRVTGKENRANIAWLEKKSRFKYMCNQSVVVCFTMITFLALGLSLSIFSDTSIFESGILFALQIIDSLQGLLILLVFVVHYLHRRMYRPCENGINEELPLQEQNGFLR